MSNTSDERDDRVVAEKTGSRRGLACLVVLLTGLLLAAGFVYYLSSVFAKWFVPERASAVEHSIPTAEAGDGEVPHGIFIPSPPHPDADFQVGRHQEVDAGAEVLLVGVVRLLRGEEAEVLGVGTPPLPDRGFDHDGRRPDVVTVPLLALEGVAEGHVEPPAIR